jgi:predicted transcriptional regulator of viral defense system
MADGKIEQVITLAGRLGLLRPRDLDVQGIPRQYLRQACVQGLVERIGRGLYRVPGALMTEHESFAEVCKKAPTAVICLLSALRFHDLTTQNPGEVWIAIGEKAHRPRIDTVATRIARFSGPALVEGVENHRIKGVAVRVYGIAKTVADCFKYRNKVGIDVAIEALRDSLSQRKTQVDDLIRYARVCRVERVMTPYLEALL